MRRWLLFVLILMAGCSHQEELPLRVGTNIWPGYEPLYLAQSLGDYAQAPIRLVEYPSASEVMRAFRNETLEAAALTLDEVLVLRQDGIPVTVVLVNDVSDGADVIIARQGMTSMKALKGKKVALETGALGAYMITRALELNGMTLNDIHVVNKDVNMHEAALLRNEVDAVVTFEPVRTRLLNVGGVEVFNSRQIPGEIVDVLVVRNSYLEKYPERVQLLVAGWFNALAYMQKDMTGAADLIAKRLSISPDEVVASYDGIVLPDRDENKKLLKGKLESTAENLGRVMNGAKLLSSPVTTEGMFSDRFISP